MLLDFVVDVVVQKAHLLSHLTYLLQDNRNLPLVLRDREEYRKVSNLDFYPALRTFERKDLA